MLQIKNLHVNVEKKEILRGVSLDLKPGEVVAVMGPNGSGKSTLAYTLAGHPRYSVVNKNNTAILIEGEDITDSSPDERSIKGIFLATQYPVAVPGLSVFSFLRQIYKVKRKSVIGDGKQRIDNKSDLIEFRKWIEKQAELLGLNKDLLKRSINDGFSGGEKKKMEILQMLVSDPKYIILDEIDSGLDVDALKKIALTVAKVAKSMKIGVLVITHYSRILKYLNPDRVIVMKEGKIVEEGGVKLVEAIEVNGYQK